MIKHTMFALAAGMLMLFIYIAQYTGAFKSVAVGLDQRGPYTLIYKDHIGPYHKIIETLESIEKWAKENQVNCQFTFGEYLDNPNLVEEGRLRARTGCLIENKNTQDIEKAKSLALPFDLKITEYPKTKAVIALFTGSPGIGPYKVYPKAEDYMREQKLTPTGPVLEIYEVLGPKTMNTTYLWPVKE